MGVELGSVAASTARQKGSPEAMTRQSATPDAGRDNGQLNRSMILQTALRIVDRDGVDGLSMRRLSEAVGRDPVMLYRHVPNKAAVLDGVAEMVLAQLSVDSTDPDWAGQLRSVARDFRQLALTHPNVVPLLVTRPLATPLGQRPPGMLRPLEDVLALLTSAGFTGKDALHIYRVLFGYLYGHILNELQEVIERPEETDDVLRLGLHRLAITAPPNWTASSICCSPASPQPSPAATDNPQASEVDAPSVSSPIESDPPHMRYRHRRVGAGAPPGQG